MVWDTFQLVSGTTGWLTALLGIALGGLALWLLFRSEDNFPVNPVRMKVQFHPSAVEAGAAFHWGMQYTRQKKHALAAYHFRRAVGRAPMNPEYYKQLGLSYAQIGRYARSLKALGQARQLKPEDPELPQIEALVRELERQAAQRET
jgi:tetratricopeptide (TPR) repeat protein